MALVQILVLVAVCSAGFTRPALGAEAEWQPGQTPGTIEITVRVTPSGGRAEPARVLPLYLLRKSFADMRQEAEEAEPPPDLERFVDSLKVSAELKDWMKRNSTVQLNGEEFLRRLTVEEIMDIPEFFEAYVARNADEISMRVSRARRPPRDAREAERQKEQFRASVRKLIVQNPLSREGMDLYLTEIDAGQRWVRKGMDRRERVRLRALELAETRYLTARLDTDLEGRGVFRGIPPGEYWVSTLDRDAHAGDVRLRWDLAVEVRAGQATVLVLSNLNAAAR